MNHVYYFDADGLPDCRSHLLELPDAALAALEDDLGQNDEFRFLSQESKIILDSFEKVVLSQTVHYL